MGWVQNIKFTGPAGAGREAYLSVWLRAEEVTTAIGGVVFADGKGAPLEPPILLSNITGTQDWTNYRIKNVLPEGAAEGQVFVGIWGRGTLWIDDFELFLAEPAVEEEKPEAPPLLPPDDAELEPPPQEYGWESELTPEPATTAPFTE